MSVTVTSNPGSESEARESIRRSKQRSIESGIAPSLSQPQIYVSQNRGKHILEVMYNIAPFLEESGLGPMNFSSAP
jgi:hypothetical protein